ncbi:MAG: hypothetical protein R6X08_06620, partial [Desulfosalsimonadaceae bacterium]
MSKGFICSSRFKVQGSRFKVQGSRFKVQGSRFKVQGSNSQIIDYWSRPRWSRKFLYSLRIIIKVDV